MNGNLWVRSAAGDRLVNLAHCEDIALHAATVVAYQEDFSHRDGALSFQLYNGDGPGARVFFEALARQIETFVQLPVPAPEPGHPDGS